MKKITRFWILFSITLMTVAIDQLSKWIAVRELAPRSIPLSYLGGSLILTYSENSGSFLGMGNSLSAELRFIFFTVFVGLILVAAIFVLFKSESFQTVQVVAVSLVLAGGLGNWIDRIFNQGAVIDFLNFGIGSLRTGILNIADLAITFGALIFLFSVWLHSSMDRANQKDSVE
ncbi:MAG: signal peptidase II [Chloroflexi bacterium HGW-Chloroflexi-10]|nr:MAG: signal peptidase II [Chloroflexi bacterium HGW-Chloroflexi-10]